MMVNNADWLMKLNYIELLREVGACFSVNNMLRAECYKQRMEKGLSFLEFNYMIDAVLRLLLPVPELRLQYAVRRRRPVEQYARRHGADPPQAGQGRARHDHHAAAQQRGQEDGQDRQRRRLARPEQDVALRFLPVLAQRGRRGRYQVHPDADLPAAGGDRRRWTSGRAASSTRRRRSLPTS